MSYSDGDFGTGNCSGVDVLPGMGCELPMSVPDRGSSTPSTEVSSDMAEGVGAASPSRGKGTVRVTPDVLAGVNGRLGVLGGPTLAEVAVCRFADDADVRLCGRLAAAPVERARAAVLASDSARLA